MAKRRATKKKTRRPTGRRALMSVRRTIRIINGVVHVDDRHVEVNRKDRIRWQNQSAGNVQVVFGSLTDPFAPGKLIDVPGNGDSEEEVIRGLPGTYKYSVVRVSDDGVTDDPNIIIRS